MKVTINETTLTAIGDAIREKTGKTDLIAPGAMADEIKAISGGGGDIEVEPIVLTGDCTKICANVIANSYLKLFGDTVSTDNISNMAQMFYNSDFEQIPFELNCHSSTISLSNAFAYNQQLKIAPKINHCKPSSMYNLFSNCKHLQIPEDYFDDWDFSAMAASTSTASDAANTVIDTCFSLRSFPMKIFQYAPSQVSYRYSYYYQMLRSCYVFENAINCPVPYTNVEWKSNAFLNTFASCYRLTNFTFKTSNGQPVVVKWKSQTIDLSKVGYTGGNSFAILDYNSGITEDKWVRTDADYQALKNDPDWYASYIQHSRYNHDSAVATINSLPDTSAYLVTAGGTNTIKFEGRAGSNTDGGAINTLTEEEIAVATAKGWTVSLV